MKKNVDILFIQLKRIAAHFTKIPGTDVKCKNDQSLRN